MSIRAVASAGLLFPSLILGCVHGGHKLDHDADSTYKQVVDCTVILAFRADVRDAESDAPVSYAEVVFRDTGMNPDAGVEPWTTRAGTSDASGLVDMHFRYGWYQEVELDPTAMGEEPRLQSEGERGEIEHDGTTGPPETHTLAGQFGPFFEELGRVLDAEIASKSFTVEIRKPGYEKVVREIVMRDCSKDNDAYLVYLGKVALAR